MDLKKWFEQSGTTHTFFARKIGVNRMTVQKWLNKSSLPTFKNYLKIKEMTQGQVPYEEFLPQIQSSTTKS